MRSVLKRTVLKRTALGLLALAAASLAGCIAYPDGPDTYTYAPVPAYGYYGPAYVTSSFYYYDAPRRYWDHGPYRRGPSHYGRWRGAPHDFSGYRGPHGHYGHGGHRRH